MLWRKLNPLLGFTMLTVQLGVLSALSPGAEAENRGGDQKIQKRGEEMRMCCIIGSPSRELMLVFIIIPNSSSSIQSDTARKNPTPSTMQALREGCILDRNNDGDGLFWCPLRRCSRAGRGYKCVLRRRRGAGSEGRWGGVGGLLVPFAHIQCFPGPCLFGLCGALL